MKHLVILFLGILIVSSTLISNAVAQQMDAKLNLALRSLNNIEDKLSNIQQGDVNQYNKLTAQLNKAAKLLKETDSKAHPDYVKSVQQWSALRQVMVETAYEWQQLQSNIDTEDIVNKKSKTNQSANSQYKSEQKSSSVDPTVILAKYQKQNRPLLGDDPTPSDVSEWAYKMKALQTTELQQDLALLKQNSVNASDTERVRRWISTDFQDQIQQDIQLKFQLFTNKINTAVQLAEQVNAIDINDKIRAYNFAKDENGRVNTQTLENGLVAIANAIALEDIYPALRQTDRQQKLASIAIAQQKMSDFIALSAEVRNELASLPSKKKAAKSLFIKGISQELWLNGSVLASLDKKGSIWMNSRDVGDVTSNGTIWVAGNDLGSIEIDGKVWFRGNHIGTLEDNGEVWRDGNQVGLIEGDGTVWIGGNSNGSIAPFEGEWKRAAIIYYFRDIFSQ